MQTRASTKEIDRPFSGLPHVCCAAMLFTILLALFAPSTRAQLDRQTLRRNNAESGWQAPTTLGPRLIPDAATGTANPSFNCAAASVPSERQICHNADLAALDRDIAQAFATTRAATQDPATLLATQREWLRRRNACSFDVVCLERSMSERLIELEALSSPRPTAAFGAASQPGLAIVPRASLPALPVPAVSAPINVPPVQPARSIVGEWEGTYTCGTVSDNQFELVITSTNDGMIAGTFSFNVPGRPGQAGRFRVMGARTDGAGQFTLAPTEWVERPAGFITVGLTGRLTPNALSISGTMLGCNSSRFEAHRKNAAAIRQANIPAPTPSERGGPLEGVWRGVITCPERRQTLTLPITIAVSQQGTNLAALLTEEVPDPRSGGAISQQAVFLSRGSDGGSPLTLVIPLANKMLPTLPRSLILDPASSSISAQMYSASCTTDVRKQEAILTPIVAPAMASLLGAWATVSPEVTRSNPQFDFLNRTTTTLLDFRSANGELFGQIQAFSPIGKPADEQDRLVASLRPLFVTPDGQIGFVITRRFAAEGVFDPNQNQNPLAQGVLLMMRPPAAMQSNLEVALSYRGYAASPNMLFERQTAGAAQAVSTGGPKLPLTPAFSGKIAQARSLKEQCEVLADWGRPLISRPDAMSASVDRLQREALPLFENDAFVPVFGRPYLALASEDRVQIFYLLDRDCPQKLKMQTVAHYDLYAPFTRQPEGSFGYSAVTTELVERHTAQASVAQAIERLPTLPETKDGLTELDTIVRSVTSQNDLLSEAERDRFPRAAADARVRIQNGILRARIADADRLPNVPASLDQLQALLTDINKSSLPANERTEVIQTIARHGQAIFRALVAEGSAKAENAPVTLAGLAEATRIARSLSQLNSRVDQRFVVANAALEPLRQRRQAILADPSIVVAFQTRLLDLAKSGPPEAIARAAAQYLEPSEITGAYQQAIQRATQQAREEQQRLTLAPDQRGPDSASATTTPATSIPTLAPSAPTSSNNEPTALEMSTAVSNIAGELSEGQTDLAGRCQRREFQNDPGLAMMCLAQMGAGGPMHVSVYNFRKLGCEAGLDRPGYFCDFSYNLNITGGRNMGVLGEMMQSVNNCTGRFVRDGNRGWLLQERRCR